MAKDDVLWFKHHAGVGRTTKMRKMAYIYGHWGKGIYWDVIESLREEGNYRYDNSEQSLNILCDIIGCKDPDKFKNWLQDCIKIGLFFEEEKQFYSPKFEEIMEVWETKKANGKKGGRGKKANRKLNKSGSKAKQKDIKDIKDSNIIKWEDFILGFNEITKKNFRGNDSVKGQLSARSKEGYSLEQILKATRNCFSDPYHREHPQYLTPEFILRADKLDKYINYSKAIISHPIIGE